MAELVWCRLCGQRVCKNDRGLIMVHTVWVEDSDGRRAEICDPDRERRLAKETKHR